MKKTHHSGSISPLPPRYIGPSLFLFSFAIAGLVGGVDIEFPKDIIIAFFRYLLKENKKRNPRLVFSNAKISIDITCS